MKNIIALFGESGSGKDFVANISSKKFKYHKVVRTTSRAPREQESQGDPYFFKDPYLLQKDIMENTEKYLEVGIFNTFIYATHADELRSDVNIGSYDVEAVDQLLQNQEINVIPVYVWAPAKLRMIRQLSRETDPDIDEICRRYFADKKKYDHFPFLYYKIDNTIKTDDIFQSLKDIVDKNIK